MLSLLGALWFSKVTSRVIGHRLYFHPSQLSTDLNLRQAIPINGQSIIHMLAILFFNFMRGKTDRLYLFWHCK